jgi:alanine dehydrogenase
MDDDTYRKAGASVVATAAEVFAGADMIVKVKEPQAGERKMLRQGQILFTISISRRIPSRRPTSSRAARSASPTRP